MERPIISRYYRLLRVVLGFWVGGLLCSEILAQSSVLDFADTVIEEAEPNGSDTPQDLPFDPANSVLAVGVEGALADSEDEDVYRFSVAADEQIAVRMDILGGSDKNITALSAGPDNLAYFVAGNNLWREAGDGTVGEATLLALAEDMASAAGLEAGDLEDFAVSDIAVALDPNGITVLVTVAGRGEILKVDGNGEVTVAVTAEQIADATGESEADLRAIAFNETGTLAPSLDENSVLLTTSEGNMVIELFGDEAPIAVANFLDYVHSGFYDGLIFHRVVGDFVIQGGGFDADLNKLDTNATIVNESLNGLKNIRGTVAMARLSDPNSATSQFYINLVDNPSLDAENQPGGFGYTVFGEVSFGMVVVDAIGEAAVGEATSPDDGLLQNVPLEPIIIESAVLSNEVVFPIYVADAISGSVLRITEDFSDVAVFAAGDDVSDALRSELLSNDLRANIVELPRTAVSQTNDAFIANGLVFIPQSDHYAAGFYVSQLGPSFNGDGSVTHIDPNDQEPSAAVLTRLFEPDASEEDLNPSAIAWDSDGAFGGKIYVGTFGADLGDDFDGQVFVLEPDGSLLPFVTAFVDGQGNEVVRGEEVVTGFFDVTDMAFSTGGMFGEYLYVISENIDSSSPSDPESVGFQSDLWRVDPSGVAELFVGSIADAAISLAFGTFAYGNDLYMGTFAANGESGKVFRVDSAGGVENFFDFNFGGADLSVSDIAFGPSDSVMQGALMLTLNNGSESFVVEVAPDTDGSSLPPTWGRGLQSGDVSSGDMVFDPEGNWFMIEQAAGQLTRLDYQNLFEYDIVDVQIRSFTPESEDDEEEAGAVEPQITPYLLVSSAERPRILSLGEAGAADTIATEVLPTFLGSGSSEDEEVSFIFSDEGEIFVYRQTAGDLQSAARNDEQELFNQFSQRLTASSIDSATDLVDAQVGLLAWAPDGTLFGQAGNGTVGAPGEDPPSQEFDDVLLELGDTGAAFGPETLVAVTDLTRMGLVIEGPDFAETFEAVLGATFEQTLDEPAPGEWRVTVQSPSDNSGEYDLLVALEGQLQNVLTVNANSGDLNLVTADGDRLRLTYSGPGRAELTVNQRPGGQVVVGMVSLEVKGASSASRVSLVNLDSPQNLSLEEIVLEGSLGRLEYAGSLDTLRGAAGSSGTIGRVDLGAVRDVVATLYRFDEFRAASLGDSDLTGRTFNAVSLRDLEVTGDIHNMTFFSSASRNNYERIQVGGVVAGSTFFGGRIRRLDVSNVDEAEAAMDGVNVTLSRRPGQLDHVRIEQGDVVNSNFIVIKAIGVFEVVEGNLDNSTLRTTASGSRIGVVLVGQGGSDDAERGAIINSRIQAVRQIKWVHADGEISGNSQILASTNVFRSSVDRVSSGGDSSAIISAAKVNRVLVGFDREGNRMSEDEEFTGADYTGRITAFFAIKEVNVTGVIRNATVQSSVGAITSVFAEDGLESTSLTALVRITRVMVGYENGRRNRIVNENADVSGTFNARKLGRLYYTGEQTVNLNQVRRTGPIIDDVPN